MRKSSFTAKRDYKKYFYGFVLFSASFIFLCFILVLTIPYHNHNNQLFAISDKIELLKNTHSPRIIFAGGSNLAFGLDSKRIEDQFKMPTINMGLHAGLGLKFILDIIIPYVKKNDIVIIVPEYSHFFGGRMYGSTELLFVLFNVYPEGRRYISLAQWMSLSEQIPSFVFTEAKSLLLNQLFSKKIDYALQPIITYDRRAFNAYGDLQGHLKGNLPFKAYKKYDGGLNPDIFTFLDQFDTEMQDRAVKVFFLFPCVQKATYENQLENINLVRDNIKTSKIKTLNAAEEGVLEDKFYFDTPYHLNDKGIELRTKQIINDLRKVL